LLFNKVKKNHYKPSEQFPKSNREIVETEVK
jgi:hypothetical protein